MKLTKQKPLSIVPNADTLERVTKQTLNTLIFIHRFRHVTARHVQLNLGNSAIALTYRQLNRLCAKGYIAKQAAVSNRFRKQAASYYLTLQGLELLKLKYPNRSFRRARSLYTDATAHLQQRERFLVLADVYAHFKRHYDGHFEFFTAFDLMHLDYMPELVPDGYVRTTYPDGETQHYFIEIYGWGRSTPLQRRRLQSYIQFADSGNWQAVTGSPNPSLFMVASSQASRARLQAQFGQSLAHSLVSDPNAFTTLAYLLDGEVSTIWRPIPD